MIVLDHNPCVLLVENDEALAQQVSLDLTEAGFTTVVASDAVIGFHQACELQPAMIVVNRALSGESG